MAPVRRGAEEPRQSGAASAHAAPCVRPRAAATLPASPEEARSRVQPGPRSDDNEGRRCVAGDVPFDDPRARAQVPWAAGFPSGALGAWPCAGANSAACRARAGQGRAGPCRAGLGGRAVAWGRPWEPQAGERRLGRPPLSGAHAKRPEGPEPGACALADGSPARVRLRGALVARQERVLGWRARFGRVAAGWRAARGGGAPSCGRGFGSPRRLGACRRGLAPAVGPTLRVGDGDPGLRLAAPRSQLAGLGPRARQAPCREGAVVGWRAEGRAAWGPGGRHVWPGRGPEVKSRGGHHRPARWGRRPEQGVERMDGPGGGGLWERPACWTVCRPLRRRGAPRARRCAPGRSRRVTLGGFCTRRVGWGGVGWGGVGNTI